MQFKHAIFMLISILRSIHGASASDLGWKAGWRPDLSTQTDLIAAQGLAKLAEDNVSKEGHTNCSLTNAAQRKEWTTLSKTERKAYIGAVLCLMSRPSRLAQIDPALAPGAKTRYDDFVAVHINSTLLIHGTANFLSWHRYFVWLYEKALREECGYSGYQPYWDWAKSAFDPINSPMFDGSDYSMGGNGVFEPHNCTPGLPTLENCIPPGQGGGCVESGPFKDYSVNLAPVSPTLQISDIKANLPFLSSNPRCLRRDISPWVSSNWTKDIDISNLITQNSDIYWFQQIMQGNEFKDGFYGVHTAGHFTIGGDPGGDIFTSPGDPAFWLHHAQIDRVWWIWQNQNLKERQNAISGTLTLNNVPPSRNGTLDDVLDLGVLGEVRRIGEVMDTIGGWFCYGYV